MLGHIIIYTILNCIRRQDAEELWLPGPDVWHLNTYTTLSYVFLPGVQVITSLGLFCIQ